MKFFLMRFKILVISIHIIYQESKVITLRRTIFDYATMSVYNTVNAFGLGILLIEYKILFDCIIT